MIRVGLSLVMLAATIGCSTPLPRACAASDEGTAMVITGDCVDEEYERPVIDIEIEASEPVAHQKISGHFTGTDVRFNIYLPPQEQWQGRFFQSVYPLYDENATDRAITFAATNGGYVVQTSSSGGYRADAAAAKLSREIAQRHYGTSQHIYGYIWGGSGGSYQTVGALENTTGVWDGGVPYIVGDPSSIPNNFFIRVLARLILRDKAPLIADAVAPGGHGDPYGSLDEAERAVLREVTAIGVPLRAWEDYRYLLGLDAADGLLGFADQVRLADPTYSEDFWTQPGYLGTESSPLGQRIRDLRLDREVTIDRVEVLDGGSDVELMVAGLPNTGYAGIVDIDVPSVEGSSVRGTLDSGTGSVTVSSVAGDKLHRGMRIRVDNNWYLALATYARHQVPDRPGFDVYDHYRAHDGSPRYPQRAWLAGAAISQGVSGGGTHTGNVNAKMIMVSNLLDADAFPWHGDWYSRQVRAAVGDRYDDIFRLWLNDNADHIAPGRTPRLIDYTGILERALLDVAAWAEKGLPPADSTSMKVVDGQVVVPPSAAERRGVQPTVHLTANGANSVQVSVGETVNFRAEIDMAGDSSEPAELAWNPYGVDGSFTKPSQLKQGSMSHNATQRVSYDRPGVYFPSVQLIQRDKMQVDDAVAAIYALGRARVVVTDR